MPQDAYVRVKKFGVFSVARTATVFGATAGVIAFILFIAAGALGLMHSLSAVGVGLIILVLLIVGAFVGGAVEAFLYNVIAAIVGPVRIWLRNNSVNKVDPLSYAKVSLVFSIIIYGLLAIFVSSVLLASIGINASAVSLPASLIGAVFVFVLVVYGFILPYVWALLYNWLASKMGGIGVVIEKDVLERLDVWSYVKMVAALSVIVYIMERIIGGAVGLAFRMPVPNQLLAGAAGLVAVVVVSLVANLLVGWFYNVVAKRFGGIEVKLRK